MKKVGLYLLIIAVMLSSVSRFDLKKVQAASTITVSQTPYIIDEAGTYKSETKLTIHNAGPAYNAWVKIAADGQPPYMEPIGILDNGSNTVTVHVVELINDGDNVTFEVYDNASGADTARESTTVSQKKIRHWTVYVAHDSHTDIGYTDYPETLINSTWPQETDDANTYIAQTDSWAKPDQFRYPMEQSIRLFGSLNSRTADQIETLKTNIKNDRLQYPASYVNTSFEAMSTEELIRYYYFSERHLKDKLGTESSGVAIMDDNPSFSWSNVDVMADMGIKYMFLGFNIYAGTPKVMLEEYPRIFYAQGRKPNNKVLIYQGALYNQNQMKFLGTGVNNAAPTTIADTTQAVSDTLMNVFQSSTYVGDAVLEKNTPWLDNGPLLSSVKDRIKEMNARVDSAGRPYAFPKFVDSNVKDFYQYVDANFSPSIPVFKGNYENYWNYGIPSDAYSESVQKDAQDNVPAAETFATFANQAGPNFRYPYQDVWNAYNNLNLYDEHTFGSSDSAVDDTHIWKRNNAITAKNLSDRIMNDSLASLSTLIPTTGQTISVFNSLSWTRSDLVKVNLSDLPAHFDITDTETSTPLKYDKLSDGTVAFVTPNVPGLGYKTFLVTARANDPAFPSTFKKSEHTLENRFFKVTFGKQGEISSIIDKQHGNVEMVDPASPYKMNEFVYDKSVLDFHTLKSESTVYGASVSIDVGALQGQMTSTGFSDGTAGIQRNVILYDALPKIDIVNVVNKIDAPGSYRVTEDEEGFFTFPLNVPDFTLRSEMPSGDFRPYVDPNINNPKNEQYYASSTDYRTVHRWIDASNPSGNYGITLFPQSAPVVEYGSRRSGLYDVDYNTPKPWIFSYVYGNKWSTNFIQSQPGPTTFKYTLMSHAGENWQAGRADKYGWQSTTPLQARVITGAQAGAGLNETKGQFVKVSADNVVMTTAKPAEANGEGTILRFNETTGVDTTVTVDLSYFNPSSVTRTDLLENDRGAMPLARGKVTFTINGYGYSTIRLKYGSAPAQVTGVTATKDDSGTLVSWTDLSDTKLAAYEVFRSTNKNFKPGSGNYMGTTSVNRYFDKQVVDGLTQPYYYKVRAVRGGLKGTPSEAATATSGANRDNPAPTAPSNLSLDYAFGNRASISWAPSTDNLMVKGYNVYRDGVRLADVPATLNSYLDITVLPGMTYRYTVKAYDQAGNLSASSHAVDATTAKGWRTPGNIAPDAAVTASSQLSARYAAAAVADGLVGDTGEWASLNEQNPRIQLTWPSAVTINRIVLYDRANATDNVNGGTLAFSDGTSMTGINGIPQDDGGKVIFFAPKKVTSVTFQAVGGTGSNVGLSEMEVFTTDSPVLPVTGISLSPSSAEMDTNTILDLTPTIAPSNATNQNITWSSSNPGVATVENGVVRSLAAGSAVITVTTEDGSHTAASNMTVINNLARTATATASSAFSSNYAASKAIDGITGVHDSGEWASQGELNPWLQLDWSSSQTVNKITFFDRTNNLDWAPGGTLTFSDGSSLSVTGIPNNGSPHSVTFPSKDITWVKFQVSGGSGLNVGLSELKIVDEVAK
ncbi:F5/8 type C domain-containing protein [Paenibacillus sp. UNC496MF]|uniref:DUF7402 domain-containing protein n=1 Tax=Paenibacillus sp. UNC496MF TaxID=1502753 RepID=UPI0008EB479E|nr:discoidin domain-containing protein [Paenibacillus sp. UNC496MF]SFJ57954.1 F5/8 type C domain-containing protein [Paenibacillus sp. UNC496MF]